MRGALLLMAVFLVGCHDFKGELDRCLDGGHCAAAPLDSGSPSEEDAGLDASTPDSGTGPCDAGLDVCVVRMDRSVLELRAVWAPPTGNRYWVGGINGYIGQCVNDVCDDRSGDSAHDWNRIEGATNFDDVILAGASSESRRFYADGGFARPSFGGGPTLYASFLSPDGETSWVSGDNAVLVRLEGTTAVPEKAEVTSEVIWDIWGEERPTLAVGNDSNGRATYWTYEAVPDGGNEWLEHPLSELPFRSVAGAGSAVWISRQVSALSPGLFRFVDGGVEADPTSPSADIWDLWVSSDGGHVFGIESGGVIAHRRPDGSWKELVPEGLGDYDLNAIAGQSGGDLWVAGQATQSAQQQGITGGVLVHLRYNP